jgi:deoxyribodipyrimidine photo-lyase
MRALYWIRNDLRLEDHPGLAAAAQANELLLVYLWPRPRPWCNLQGLGAQRARFLSESLQELAQTLQAQGQNLLLLQGSAELVLPDLVRDYRIDTVHLSACPGVYETRAVEVLRDRLSVPLTVHRGNTLFSRSDIDSAVGALPDSFSPFRRSVEKHLAPGDPAPTAVLPPPPAVRFHAIPPADSRPHVALPLRGGRAAGLRRLRQFIDDEQAIRHYKETRNCLDPLDGSSTLSPWLASGALSAREVAAAIRNHEAREGGNDSTYWLYFELLWREYFQWRAYADGNALFRAAGRSGRVHRCTFEPRNFARWCAGDTDYPLVNACMRQLLATGWMSNRGRQLAASCLVHDYGIDWRYGAAFFEKHLIDFDVASNYGNWQYIAGVGADPRGGRHFNQEKQAAEYDPEGIFTAKWDGHQPTQPRYVTDAADWPL